MERDTGWGLRRCWLGGDTVEGRDQAACSKHDRAIQDRWHLHGNDQHKTFRQFLNLICCCCLDYDQSLPRSEASATESWLVLVSHQHHPRPHRARHHRVHSLQGKRCLVFETHRIIFIILFPTRLASSNETVATALCPPTSMAATAGMFGATMLTGINFVHSSTSWWQHRQPTTFSRSMQSKCICLCLYYVFNLCDLISRTHTHRHRGHDGIA